LKEAALDNSCEAATTLNILLHSSCHGNTSYKHYHSTFGNIPCMWVEEWYHHSTFPVAPRQPFSPSGWWRSGCLDACPHTPSS